MRAPAKVNLALHVTGQRAGGYHLLDSLVVFVDVGDELTLTEAEGVSLVVDGPFASALAGTGAADNLVLKAYRAMQSLVGSTSGAALRLTKNLPIASGIGGGSADAAAAIHLAAQQFEVDVASRAVQELALRLGADVPMCLASRPLRAQGVGELITPVAPLPSCGVVLVNPGVAVSTPAIFKRLTQKTNPPLADLPLWSSAEDLAQYLAGARNDLQGSAIEEAPVIADVLGELRAVSLMARMSGSGATCFAILPTLWEAQALAARLQSEHPAWWVVAAAWFEPEHGT